MPAVPFPAAFSRRARVTLVLALAALALALAARGVRVARARTAPTGRAEWIWADLGRAEIAPVAFYAARDFDLGDLPPARARLLAVADEEYVLYLNGRRVGSDRCAPGPVAAPPLDAYEVGPLLLPGANRLVAELRSGRSEGGFLASLVDTGSGRPLVATDPSWKVFRHAHPGLLRGTMLLTEAVGWGEAKAARSWSLPPTGRWGMPRLPSGPPRPTFAALTGDLQPMPGATAAPGDLVRLDRRQVFDWGREVEGYLTLELAPADRPGVGLLLAGPTAANPLALPMGAAAAPVIVAPRATEWEDALPRRFRYAVVVGMERVLGARVTPLDPRAAGAATLVAGDRPAEEDGKGVPGVLGLSPPPLRSPVEDEVRREVERLPGVAGRKQL